MILSPKLECRMIAAILLVGRGLAWRAVTWKKILHVMPSVGRWTPAARRVLTS